MIEYAQDHNDLELLEKVSRRKFREWERICSEAHDLVFFGKYTYKDVGEMPPHERRFLLNLVRKHLEEHPSLLF